MNTAICQPSDLVPEGMGLPTPPQAFEYDTAIDRIDDLLAKKVAADGGHFVPETNPKRTIPKQIVTSDWNSLLNNAKAGNDSDRNRLLEQLHKRLIEIGRSRLRGWPIEEIEDIVQDSLVVFLSKIEAVNDNPHHFAHVVLLNKIGGLLRQRKRRTMISLNPTGAVSEQEETKQELQLPSESYDEMLDHMRGSEIAEKLRIALKQLSPLCQAVFLALLNLGSVAEVWSEYQDRTPRITRSAFDKRISDCRKKLRLLTEGQLA